jgi:hypothetical protein
MVIAAAGRPGKSCSALPQFDLAGQPLYSGDLRPADIPKKIVLTF